MAPTPRALALARAAELAADTVARSRDMRHHIEAELIKREAQAELERTPGSLPSRRRSLAPTWGHKA
jgi:hypothetical protein